ncbi:response regulator [Isosphaeraceae bacterium EP7]
MAAEPMRILIVDDDVDTARMMRALLKPEGYAIRIEHDGLATVEAARSFDPDVVLMDLTLPGMNGTEAAEAIRALPPRAGCTILAVSGFEAPAEGPASPFDGHYVKPVRHDALLAHLRRIDAARSTVGDA